ncbi:aminotransferase, partial [Streptomyces sp. SID5926]|nr:aminotransferase [Streptomyces sp. SID5926]
MTAADPRVQLVRDATFVRLRADGDISGTRGSAPDGLFLQDARHLSRWHLAVDGTAPTALVPVTPETDDTAAGALTPEGTRDNPPAYTVFRRQSVAAGTFTEHLSLVSNRPDAVTARLDLTVDADFADLFELRADDRHYAKPGAEYDSRDTADGVLFSYRRADWHARTEITCDPAPDTVAAAPARPGDTARKLTW